MARIRSIHPGIFTDEAFVALSADAQVLLFGIWTEADDQGVFEWKPVTLRMRLRPAKDGDVEAFLAELMAVNAVCRFEVGGRQYGAIRNFRKYQRPKKPNAVHPMPPEIRTYVFLDADGSEIDDDETDAGTELSAVKPRRVLPKSEIAPQMEDGGGRREAGGDSRTTSGVASLTPPPTLVPYIEIPTNRFETAGEQFPVYEPMIEEFQRLYPAVDVRAELRKMRGWSINNPAQRKTRKGMGKFVNGWLSRQQDKPVARETSNGGRHGGQSANRSSFGSEVSRAVQDRAGSGLFDSGEPEIIQPVRSLASPRPDEEEGGFGRAADAA